jgi:hypothetical protein
MSTALGGEVSRKVVKEFVLTSERSRRLGEVAQARSASEDEVIERALDLYFQLTDFFSEGSERRAWQRLSETSLSRVWENDQDAAYDNWRELYDLPEG